MAINSNAIALGLIAVYSQYYEENTCYWQSMCHTHYRRRMQRKKRETC